MNENKKKKSQGFPWALLVLLIPLLRGISSGNIQFGGILIVVGVIIVVAVLGVSRKKAAAEAMKQRPDGDRPQPTVQTSRPVPSMQRREPSTAAHRDFPKPEAPCVVCEQTGEDHFARDRRRRIAQLDEWLKNGLIDRAEYQVMKRRYENDQ